MTPLQNDLESLGLSRNQSSVYLALFRMNEAKAGEIIKKTGMHRNLVYVALQDLINKKLVTKTIVKRVSLYRTLSPTRFLSVIHEKERVAKNIINELSVISRKSTLQEIQVYEGIDDLRSQAIQSYRTMQPNTIIRYLSISPAWYEIIGPTLLEDLFSIQKTKNVKMRAITNSISLADRNAIQNSNGLLEARVNPLVSTDTNAVEIHDDKIVIRSFVEPYFAVEIIHKHLAENYKNYFDFLWRISKHSKATQTGKRKRSK